MMPQATNSVLLPAPVERAWAFATEVRLWPVWLRGVEVVRNQSTAMLQAGTRFEVVRTLRREANPWIVAEWAPMHHARFTDYRQNIQLSFEFVPESSGCQLAVRLAWPRARGWLGDWLSPLSANGRWAQALLPSLNDLPALFAAWRDLALRKGRSS